MGRYRAFISYSHEDEALARWLHRGLENYRIPRHVRDTHGLSFDRLTPIFRDREELASSTDLSASILTALAESEALIVICSPAGARSEWVNAEVEAFLDRDDPRVFSLLVGGRSSQERFPRSLRDQEPLAADLEIDGRRGAKLKLISGLLGIRLDELVQRDAHRRQRRLMQIAAGAGFGMLIAVGLALYALAAEREAASAKVAAEREARLANELTEFLLGMFEAANPADQRGAEITARELLARSADRIDTVSSNSNVTARIQQALGQAYLQLHLFPESQAHLERARLGAEDGDDEALLISIEQQIAQLSMYRGEFARAESDLARLVERARAMRAPDEVQIFRMTGNLATAKLYQGKTTEATDLLIEAHEGLSRALGPDHEETLRTRSAFSVALARSGRVDEAIDALADTLERQRATLGPDHPHTMDSLANLATFHMRQSDWERASVLTREAMRLHVQVYGEDSAQTAQLHANLSYVLLQTGDFAEAEQHARAARRMLSSYMGDYHAYTLQAEENLSEALIRQGLFASGERILREQTDRVLAELGPVDPRSVRAVLHHRHSIRRETLETRRRGCSRSTGTMSVQTPCRGARPMISTWSSSRSSKPGCARSNWEYPEQRDWLPAYRVLAACELTTRLGNESRFNIDSPRTSNRHRFCSPWTNE
jgi:tetratricopeptide (TPR) repeat protein